MKFFTTKSKTKAFSIRTVCLEGIAPDGGLFMPESIPALPQFLRSPENFSLEELALEIAKPFFSEAIPEDRLREIISEVLSFPIPLVHIRDRLFALELFHGPTMAFKDFGAMFLARVLSSLRAGAGRELTVIVATSGDTGGAVARGFFRVPGVRVVILYPSGRVSPLQEQQMTRLGENIIALEISGSFDDCQRLAKDLLGDGDVRSALDVTSANSINFARLLPQTFYYVEAVRQLRLQGFAPGHLSLVMSVPSGNLGNLCAGVFAKRLGLPISHFLLATNRNDTAVQFLRTGNFSPRIPERTLSNAMDVGNPSNLERLITLYEDHASFLSEISGSSWDEDDTRRIIGRVFRDTGYILDPHGAIGYLALEEYATGNPECTGCFLATAHPGKFPECVEGEIGKKITTPEALRDLDSARKISIRLSAEYDEVRAAVLALAAQ